MSPERLAAPFAAVRQRMAAACDRAGRDPATVQLVAVSKTQPVELVRQALASGHHLFGENRVQEALDKIRAVGEGARWHLIGHLQRNKARHAVGAFELIHGVDSTRLARELDSRAAARGLRQAILLQVNLSREATKSGLPRAEAASAVKEIAALAQLELRGLMTIPPPAALPEDNRPFFLDLRRLRDELAAAAGLPLPDLSMGMTDDFEVAIEEGATLIRVGTALFGPRHLVE